MARPGLIDLRDMRDSRVWQERSVQQLLAQLGLVAEVSPAWRHYEPPSVLIVVSAWDGVDTFVAAAPWLARADAVYVLIVDKPEVSDDVAWSRAFVGVPVRAVTYGYEHARYPILQALQQPVREPPPLPTAVIDRELPGSDWFAYSAGDLRSRLVRDGDEPALRATDGLVRLAAPRALVCAGLDGAPPGQWACGEDPVHPLRWRGSRMYMYWWHRGGGFFATSLNDWPNTHAKKLWGFKDNDAVAMALAPDLSAMLEHFEHDVVYSEAVPIAWHRAGNLDVALFSPDDPQRATFFAQTASFTDGIGSLAPEDDPLDDDHRELAPAMVLGERCYAVDLTLRTVRIRGRDPARVEHIGGPDAGYAVFDAQHQLVRRGRGQLLGGWYRYATVHDGALWREDVMTGERTPIAAPPCAPHADLVRLAIPGTRNLLEVLPDRYRVV